MTGQRNDPTLVFAFGLQISLPSGDVNWENGTAFFKSVGGLKAESEVIEYHEGGVNTHLHKLIGGTKWPNLVLKQGFTGSAILWQWRTKRTRVNGVVVQLGPNKKVIAEWRFVNGWPCKWEGPDYDASKNELAIESIEIAHDGLTFVSHK